ncbi:hypothetical protein RAMLITH_13030 [Ramlibacter sp. RBP-2]|uniref:Uncharacterized protein n=1 Tax=Ramlibacter lithotrophicus TaxID=2606681 RepID=A0A7X6DGJ3_9BURK|nr:hypothetical protein [Ramlibacter lithotrophicus]NKE66750.1 hypothetical protein [Ramlibacter lithotrophicus]
MSRKQNARDKQAARSGKVENDANKMGETAPTQKNEGRRTPESRHDRESHIGGENQSMTRKGGPSSGIAPKSGHRP